MAAGRRLGGRVRAYVLAPCVFLFACAGAPTASRDTTLTDGRWTGGGACLSVAAEGCNLTIGCGHGQFPKPLVHADGTFEVEGTYRIEAGPISINPAPPAHFSGVLAGGTLRLNVVPSGGAPPPASYTMRPGSAGSCTVPCL